MSNPAGRPLFAGLIPGEPRDDRRAQARESPLFIPPGRILFADPDSRVKNLLAQHDFTPVRETFIEHRAHIVRAFPIRRWTKCRHHFIGRAEEPNILCAQRA
jgi:hypothetical protein